MSQFFTSDGQSIGVSASESVLPMNIQSLFSLGLSGLIYLLSKGLSRVFSSTTVQKHHFFGTQPSLWSSSHIHTWLLEKTIPLTRRTFVGQEKSLLFNMLSRLVIAFLPRNEHLLISWLQSPSADLPYPGIEPGSPALQTDSLLLSHLGSPRIAGFHEKMGRWREDMSRQLSKVGVEAWSGCWARVELG